MCLIVTVLSYIIGLLNYYPLWYLYERWFGQYSYLQDYNGVITNARNQANLFFTLAFLFNIVTFILKIVSFGLLCSDSKVERSVS